MKDYRFLVLLFLVLIASVFIIYPLIIGEEGVIVTSVEPDSACKNEIRSGSYITEITGKRVRNVNDFNTLTKDLKGPITLLVDYNPRSCTISENSSLNIKVRNVKEGGLKTSAEIGGGSYFVFKPENEVTENDLQDILSIIKSRANQYKLINTIGYVENESIYLISGPQEDNYVSLLTEPGLLEGKIIKTVYFTDKKSEFTLNNSLYEVRWKDENSITINGSIYKKNQDFVLNNLNIKVDNITGNSTSLSIHIFENKELIFSEDLVGSSRILKQGGGYVFVLPIELSDISSENFARSTAGQEIAIDPGSGEGYLRDPLIISIDGTTFINLPIRAVDAGKPTKELVLWKFTQTEKEASDDLIRLKSLIEFKNLPTELLLINTGDYESDYGGFYLNLFFYGVLATTGIFLIFALIRYKKSFAMALILIILVLVNLIVDVGVIQMPWFVLSFFCVCVVFVVWKGDLGDWIGWASLLLMFVLSIGISMTNLILDVYSIISMLGVYIFGLIIGFFVSDKTIIKDVHITGEYKKSLKLIWKFSLLATIVLLVLFFSLDDLRGLTTIIYVGIFSFVSLTVPIYFNFLEKTRKKT